MRIKVRTGETNLNAIETKARAEIANWKLKDAAKNSGGSNYFIITEDEWHANEKIKDRKQRLLHFLLHAFYVGDESDQSRRGKDKTMFFKRWSNHTHDIRLDGSVDESMQRLCNIKSVGIYYDAIAEHRAFHWPAESIVHFILRCIEHHFDVKQTSNAAIEKTKKSGCIEGKSILDRSTLGLLE